MAKLSARGRTEYLRARKGDLYVAYMSDGVVLSSARDALTGRMGRWRVAGTWDRVGTSMPVLRSILAGLHWEILSGDGPRAGSLAATLARKLAASAGLPCR